MITILLLIIIMIIIITRETSVASRDCCFNFFVICYLQGSGLKLYISPGTSILTG